jgi:hypothetical protein
MVWVMRPRLSSFLVLGAVTAMAAAAGAQTPAPGAPPPAPPPGYPPPPPYYAPYPPPYAYAPPPAQPPPILPYREGEPIPAGYHLEEHPRKGLVTAGWILTGISYGIGVTAASSASFKNESGWLAVPLAGPWLTLGRRDYHCDKNSHNYDSADCVGDVFVVMGLIMDGVLQTGGGTLLLVGYLSTKQELVRDDVVLRIRPMRVGSGHGVGVSGSF